jgi:hypothetical protein
MRAGAKTFTPEGPTAIESVAMDVQNHRPPIANKEYTVVVITVYLPPWRLLCRQF